MFCCSDIMQFRNEKQPTISRRRLVGVILWRSPVSLGVLLLRDVSHARRGFLARVDSVLGIILLAC